MHLNIYKLMTIMCKCSCVLYSDVPIQWRLKELDILFCCCVVQMSASGPTVGGLNFNNSSSAASGLQSRGVSLPLAPVADAGKSYGSFFGCD